MNFKVRDGDCQTVSSLSNRIIENHFWRYYRYFQVRIADICWINHVRKLVQFNVTFPFSNINLCLHFIENVTPLDLYKRHISLWPNFIPHYSRAIRQPLLSSDRFSSKVYGPSKNTSFVTLLKKKKVTPQNLKLSQNKSPSLLPS